MIKRVVMIIRRTMMTRNKEREAWHTSHYKKTEVMRVNPIHPIACR